MSGRPSTSLILSLGSDAKLELVLAGTVAGENATLRLPFITSRSG